MVRIMPGALAGEGVVGALVRAYRWSWEPFPGYIRAVSPEEVREWLGRGESGVILLGRRIVGACWAWSRGWLGHVWLFYDTRLPHPYRIALAAQAFEWAAWKLSRRDVTVVDVRAGLHGSQLHNDLRRLLAGCAVELRHGSLMVGPLEAVRVPEPARTPTGLEHLELVDCRSLSPEGIAGLLNAAFSRYRWWEPVSSEHVAWRLARPSTMCIALASGEGKPVALLDVTVTENLLGHPLVEPLYLAVHPSLQGRGIGSWLVAKAVEHLKARLERGLVVVDSAMGLERFYAKYGLAIKTWWTIIRLPLDYLRRAS